MIAIRSGVLSIFGLLLVLAGVTDAADADTASNPFEIKTVQRATKAVALVDNAWKNSVPCIQVELRVTRDLEPGKVYARAYFFDKDGKLIIKYPEPPQVSDDHRTYYSIPALFKPKQIQKVAFPINDKKEKWSRVVLVFGNREFAVAEAFPKDELTKFDFPEKDLVLKTAAAPAH